MDLKLLLIGALMLVNISMANAQMSGLYTVGSGGDYLTIGEAITDINSGGLSGDVTLQITTGSYAERIDLSNLNNGDFTVTLEGESQQTTLAPPNQDAASIKAGIVMESTNNVIIRNLTYDLSGITDNTSSSDQNIYGVYLSDISKITMEEIAFLNTTPVVDNKYEISETIRILNSQDITIASNQFKGALRHIEISHFTNLSVTGNSFENTTQHIRYVTGTGSRLEVIDNIFQGGGNGLEIARTANGTPSDITIKDNEFNEQTEYSIGLTDIEDFDINGNQIVSTIVGSVLIEEATNGSIRNNKINTIGLGLIGNSAAAAITLYDSDYIQLFNNIIAAERVAFGVDKCNSIDIIHNTFHSDQIGFRNFKASGDYFVITQPVVIFTFGGDNLVLKNNIFSGVVPQDGDGNTAIMFEPLSGNTFNITADYNLFDADLGMAVEGNSSNVVVNGTTVFGEFSLSEWKTLINLDQNSVLQSPEFIDGSDFRIDNGDFRFGTYLSEYTTDIDGETRVEGFVDIGADQYCEAIEVSASVEACVSYKFDGNTLTESGEYTGEFVASNGCDSVVTLNLTILGPTAGSGAITAEGFYDWNGIIYTGTGIYEQTLINQDGCDSIATLELTITPLFLEGNFIIGSSSEADYPNFTKAALELRYATIIGDIEYLVEAGTYNDTLNLSSVNTGDFSVAFNGEDKAATILHPLTDIEACKAGILIDETYNITIRNLTLEMDDISDGKVRFNSYDTKGISIINADNTALVDICFKNDSEDAVFDDNDFYISSALFADSVNDLSVDGCSFSGAGVHIVLGDHHDVNILENDFQTAREVITNTGTGIDLSIENNDFSGYFNSCIELNEIENLAITTNSIDGTDSTISGFAILLDETNSSAIKGNIIENTEYGIDLSRDTLALIAQNIVRSIDREAFYASRTVDLKVVNNFFGDIVFLDRQINLDFIHNTVVSQKERDEVIFFEESGDATGDVSHRMINNIFVGGGQVDVFMMIVDEDDDLNLSLDHNLYHFDDITGPKPFITYEGMNATTNYATLEDWQNEGTYDQNSQSFAPNFVNDDDFHITDDSDYRFGTFLSDVTNDIDGDIRIASIGVDVGADQYCEPSSNEEVVEACESYEWNGTTYSESGIYQELFTSSVGCDSTVTLNLTILETSLSKKTVETCRSYDWNGMTYTESGIYEKLFTNVAGCDSTAILQLTIIEEIKCLPTSISENSNGQKVVAYPNPTFNGLINLEGLPIHSTYSLFDLSGKEVSNGTLNGLQHQLQLPSRSGTYLLQVNLGNEQIQLKIIKK